MEQLVKYVSKTQKLQEQIICLDDSDLIEAIYRLFLHYGCSCEHLIKAGFQNELEISGEEAIFRSVRKMDRIFTEFFLTYGGKFDLIHNELKSLAVTMKAGKNGKNLKNAIIKSIDYIEKVFTTIISGTLIDFCRYVYTAYNRFNKESRKFSSQNIICSFVFFSLISNPIINNIAEGTESHVKPLICALAKISVNSDNFAALGVTTSGKAFAIPDLQTFVSEQNKRFKVIIALSLMDDCISNYTFSSQLSAIRYQQYAAILKKALGPAKIILIQTNSDREMVPPSEQRDLNSIRLSQPLSNSAGEKQIHQKLHPKFKGMMLECTRSLEKLIVDIPQEISDINDIKYFMLWSHDEVMELVIKERLNVDFFRKWLIDGQSFLQLNPDVLGLMGMIDKEDINLVIKLHNEISIDAITNTRKLDTKELKEWIDKDIHVWLKLSELSHLIEIFRINKIDGSTFISLTIDNLNEFGIVSPKDIIKLNKLKNNKEEFSLI